MIKVDNVRNVRNELNVIYIGRKCGKYEGSVLGNPFKIAEISREEVIEEYRKWLWIEINKKGEVWNELLELLKKYKLWGDMVLVCWCSPEKCHGDIIKRCLEWMIKEGY